MKVDIFNANKNITKNKRIVGDERMKRLCFYKSDGEDVVRSKPEYDELWEHCYLLEEENAKLKEQLKTYLSKIIDYCETQYNRFENTSHKTGYGNEDISNAYFDVQNFVEDIISEIKEC